MALLGSSRTNFINVALMCQVKITLILQYPCIVQYHGARSVMPKYAGYVILPS